MKRIALTGNIDGKRQGIGKFVLVDDCDYDRLIKYKWHLSMGYALTSYAEDGKRKKLRMHRFILEQTDPKISVDHINGDALDNRRENIRIGTNRQNLFNCHKQKKYNGKKCSSKYKGVNWNKKAEKWIAYISIDKKLKHLGCFDTEEEAYEVRQEWAEKIYKEYNNKE